MSATQSVYSHHENAAYGQRPAGGISMPKFSMPNMASRSTDNTSESQKIGLRKNWLCSIVGICRLLLVVSIFILHIFNFDEPSRILVSSAKQRNHRYFTKSSVLCIDISMPTHKVKEKINSVQKLFFYTIFLTKIDIPLVYP